MFKKTLLIFATTAMLAACGPEATLASADTVESARIQAKKNAQYNARVLTTEDIVFTGWAIEAQTDSSITPTCPQGDGWASVVLRNRANMAQVQGLKCSTASTGIGCLPDEVFNTKSYKQDDGNCQPTSKVPFPLPKLGG